MLFQIDELPIHFGEFKLSLLDSLLNVSDAMRYLAVRSFFSRLSCVDREADCFGAWCGFVTRAFLPSRKNRNPLQCQPLTSLAIAVSDLYRRPSYSKPSCRTITRIIFPLCCRSTMLPGGGNRGSQSTNAVGSGTTSFTPSLLCLRGAVTRVSASTANSSAFFSAALDNPPSSLA